MLMETHQISNLSQDVSKEILSDLERKNVAEFTCGQEKKPFSKFQLITYSE